HMSLVDQVHQSAWCGDKHVYPLAHPIHLGNLRNTATNRQSTTTNMLTVCGDTLVKLYGQLPSRDKHQCTGHFVFFSIRLQQLQNRQCKGCCFAGSGLCTTDNILPLQYKWYCLLLYRCCQRIPYVVDGFYNRIYYPKILKTHFL